MEQNNYFQKKQMLYMCQRIFLLQEGGKKTQKRPVFLIVLGMKFI